MPQTPDALGDGPEAKKPTKLGLTSGVFIPVFLNILSILMFLRFGLILGQVGFLGFLGASLFDARRASPQRCILMRDGKLK